MDTVLNPCTRLYPPVLPSFVSSQRSKRLDSEQAISKETLMMANEEVVKACQEGRTSSWVSRRTVETSHSSVPCASQGLEWNGETPQGLSIPRIPPRRTMAIRQLW